MTTTDEIEQAFKELPKEDQWALLDKPQNKLEDELEFTDEFKAKIEQGKRDIAEGRARVVKP